MKTLFKTLFSIFVLALMLSGVFSAPESSHFSKETTSSIQSAVDSHVSHEADGSNCDDEGQTCHKCHLGHCAFPIRLVSVGYLTFEEHSVFDSYKHSLTSAIIDSLYRPPIS